MTSLYGFADYGMKIRKNSTAYQQIKRFQPPDICQNSEVDGMFISQAQTL
jgi:hypothetical protein